MPRERSATEPIAVQYRDRIDGLLFSANDDVEALVPRARIEAFAARLFRAVTNCE
jgi:hypothetical protein